MSKIKEKAIVISQECIATDIYSMWIRTDIAKEAKCGQFINVYTKDSSKLLPRPISICEIEKDSLRIVYRVVGAGTAEFAGYSAGDDIEIMGPLGNGFPIKQENNAGGVILIGGGIGVPPMLETAKQLVSLWGNENEMPEIVLGYRNDELFLIDEFKKTGNVHIATDDGSVGTKGTVIDAILEQGVMGKVIYACGPKPMLKAIKDYAASKGITAWISMEERMACGVGACLGCVCKTTKVDDHSKVMNARVCVDGPVFNAEEVDLS